MEKQVTTRQIGHNQLFVSVDGVEMGEILKDSTGFGTRWVAYPNDSAHLAEAYDHQYQAIAYLVGLATPTHEYSCADENDAWNLV